MRLGALALAAALSALACAGELVETRRRVKGPVAEVGWLDPGGGHAKYSLEGGGWAVEERRKDTLARIGAYCAPAGPQPAGTAGAEDGPPRGGRYRVVDEVDRGETETPFTADLEENIASGSRHHRQANYRHLYFECEP